MNCEACPRAAGPIGPLCSGCWHRLPAVLQRQIATRPDSDITVRRAIAWLENRTRKAAKLRAEAVERSAARRTNTDTESRQSS